MTEQIRTDNSAVIDQLTNELAAANKRAASNYKDAMEAATVAAHYKEQLDEATAKIAQLEAMNGLQAQIL